MILVLLPAYNEEASLPQLMPKLKKTLSAMNEEYRIIVCDDGSSDQTYAMLEQYAQDMPVDIIHHKINRGLGESSRDLFERASEIAVNGDVIVRLDCDDTHEPEFIPTIVAKCEAVSTLSQPPVLPQEEASLVSVHIEHSSVEALIFL